MIWHRTLIVLSLLFAVLVAALVLGARRGDPVNRAFLAVSSLVIGSLVLQVLLFFPCYIGLEEPILKAQAALWTLTGLGFLLLSMALVGRPVDRVFAAFAVAVAAIVAVQVGTNLSYVGFLRHGPDVTALTNPKLDLAFSAVAASPALLALFLLERHRRRLANPDYRSMLLLVEGGIAGAMALMVVVTSVWPLLRADARPPSFEGPVLTAALLLVYHGIWRHNLFDVTLRSAASSLFESVRDGIALLDTAGSVRHINRAGQGLLGVTGWSGSDPALDALLRQRVPEPTARNRLLTWTVAGRPRYLSVSKSANFKHGVALGHMLVFSDAGPIVEAQNRLRAIHDSLEKEVELRAAQLADAQKLGAIGGLARNVAHVLNNQLAVIIGLTESVTDRSAPGSQLRTDLDDILAAAARAGDMVAQIGPEGRGEDEARRSISLRMVLKEALRSLGVGLPNHIRIKLAYDVECFVLGHPTQLLQVFVNLGKNATEAMLEHGGSLTLRLRAVEDSLELRSLHESLRPGPYARVDIADTGCGVPEELLVRIFDPLFTTKAAGQGTGLGLASAKRIVEEHGGAIAVASEVGQGTVFTVYIPLIERNSREEPSLDLAYLGGTERLLVVDDEAEVARATARSLTALGYEVVVSLDPHEALSLVHTSAVPFALVITDQSMPRMTGTALTERIKEHSAVLPVIVLSGTATKELARQAEAAGAALVLPKPATRAVLARAVRGELDR